MKNNVIERLESILSVLQGSSYYLADVRILQGCPLSDVEAVVQVVSFARRERTTQESKACIYYAL